MKSERNTSRTRRRLLAGLAVAGAQLSGLPVGHAQTRPNKPTTPTIDVKKLGAFGNGKLPDLRQIRAAIEAAGERPGGATVYFPPGEYYLGAADSTWLLNVTDMRDIRLVGERATLTCRSVAGASSIIAVAGSRNITIEGLAFRDHAADRDRQIGASGVRLVNNGTAGCEGIEIRDCTFESVDAGVVARSFEETRRVRFRDITLRNLTVSRSLYGFNFQDAGDNVTGRGLRCSDCKRSYFPYGVTNHDIELDTANNATGFTDVLISCYLQDTTNIRVKLKVRAKRGGDTIINLDHQNRDPGRILRNIRIEADIDDVDCNLDAAIQFRALDKNRRTEQLTARRWDAIYLDGDIRICDKTKLFYFESVSKTPGTLTIGPKLARHPRLPRTFPGFNATVA